VFGFWGWLAHHLTWICLLGAFTVEASFCVAGSCCVRVFGSSQLCILVVKGCFSMAISTCNWLSVLWRVGLCATICIKCTIYLLCLSTVDVRAFIVSVIWKGVCADYLPCPGKLWIWYMISFCTISWFVVDLHLFRAVSFRIRLQDKFTVFYEIFFCFVI